ncbi:MAG: hypothetical protein HY870_24025 [Chloroflexi bacterium]|nr:hypothetical protein [Chloroflexota bacterium]
MTTPSDALPESLAAAFQEYDFKSLDLDRDRDLIIERTLGAGNLAELRWLFARFPIEAIKAWVQRRGAARLPYRRFNLWRVVFDIETFEHPRYWRQTAWPY